MAKPNTIKITFTHEELTVMQDVLDRVKARVGSAVFIFADEPALVTAIDKARNGMFATAAAPGTDQAQ
jgi:hypothetical protein